MPEFILFMHDDASAEPADWGFYLEKLSTALVLRGGSEIGDGTCLRRDGGSVPIHTNIVGFVRVEALDLEHAKSMIVGNPAYEAGGTIEIRALPRSN